SQAGMLAVATGGGLVADSRHWSAASVMHRVGLRQTEVIFNAVADPLDALHDARIIFKVTSHRNQLPQFGQVHHLVHQLRTSTKSPSAVNRNPSAAGTRSWCSRL